VSEWLTFQAQLLSINLSDNITKIVVLFSGAGLALTGALAAACFVKPSVSVSLLFQEQSSRTFQGSASFHVDRNVHSFTYVHYTWGNAVLFYQDN